jgi:hypothetical protein
MWSSSYQRRNSSSVRGLSGALEMLPCTQSIPGPLILSDMVSWTMRFGRDTVQLATKNQWIGITVAQCARDRECDAPSLFRLLWSNVVERTRKIGYAIPNDINSEIEDKAVYGRRRSYKRGYSGTPPCARRNPTCPFLLTSRRACCLTRWRLNISLPIQCLMRVSKKMAVLLTKSEVSCSLLQNNSIRSTHIKTEPNISRRDRKRTNFSQ